MLRIAGKFFYQSTIQAIFTSLLVVALVIYLLSYLPDFATYDESDTVTKSNSSSEGDLSQSHENIMIQGQNFFQNNRLFWKNAFANEFGFSRVHEDQTVWSLIKQSSMISVFLLGLSLLCSTLMGGFLGLVSGFYYGRPFEKGIQLLGTIMTSMPSFLLAPILIFIFSVHWHLFPTALWKGPVSLVLPVITMALRPSFYLARLFSKQITDTLSSDFIKVAKAKGLSLFSIWCSHVIPNSLATFIVAVGNLLGQLLAGLFIVEALFALPGLGHLFVRSLAERDYPLFLALVLIFSLIMQLGHRMSDLALLLFIPRMGAKVK